MSRDKAEERFSFRALKGERVMIYSDGAHVTTLSGKAAAEFIVRVERNPERAPLLMAKATGNYKRGNERSSRRSS
jgi:hypothetical protein